MSLIVLPPPGQAEAIKTLLLQRVSPLPLSEEGAASILDVLQLEEARPHQQRLDVLLVYGQVTVVGKVDQSLERAEQRGEKVKNK